jgi:hypothetical protein
LQSLFTVQVAPIGNALLLDPQAKVAQSAPRATPTHVVEIMLVPSRASILGGRNGRQRTPDSLPREASISCFKTRRRGDAIICQVERIMRSKRAAGSRPDVQAIRDVRFLAS